LSASDSGAGLEKRVRLALSYFRPKCFSHTPRSRAASVPARAAVQA
jgi:hypothetical protein